MQILLTGATGLVGSGVLHHILALSPTAAAAKHINRVTVLSRKPEIPLLTHPLRPTANTHTAIDVIPHADFSAYPDALLARLRQHSDKDENDDDEGGLAVIWALGMSQNDARSPAQYAEVTRTYAVRAAEALAEAYAPRRVVFVYVSGEGATARPAWYTPLFGRVKGAAERELLGLAGRPGLENLAVYNVRPASVDPGRQPAVDDWFTRVKLAGEGVVKRGLVRTVLPLHRRGWWAGMHSPTDELGRVLTELGRDGEGLEGRFGLGKGDVEDGGWTVRNAGLRKLAAQME